MLESLSERAYVHLRDRILELELPPGSPLNEGELSRDLGIGRTPIRDAIKRLERESLVEVFPRRGTFVTDIHITDLGSISEVRMELEALAAELAARRYRADRDGADLKALLRRLDRVAEATPQETMSLDVEIHRFTYRVAGNPYLEQSLISLFQLSFRMWNFTLARSTEERELDLLGNIAPHLELLQAIEGHNTAAARKLARDHVRVSEQQIRDLL